MANADLKEEGKALGGIIANARKAELNFALLMGKAGLVLEADRRRPAETLKRTAKSNGGGAKGVWGTMRVEANRVILTCEEEPPGGFKSVAKKHFAERGFPIQVVMHLKGAEPSDEEDDGETTPRRTIKEEERNGDDIESIMGEASEPAHGEDAEPPENPADPDDEDDLLAAQGDFEALIRAVRKRPYNFAWLKSAEGMVLQAHKRRPVEMLMRLAKAQGGLSRGGWGTMFLEGKTLALTCTEDPPTTFAKSARVYLKDQSQNYRVVVRSPSGETVDEPEPEGVATADNGAEAGSPAERMRSLHVEAGTLRAALVATLKGADNETKTRAMDALQSLKAALDARYPDLAAEAIGAVRAQVAGERGGPENMGLPRLDKLMPVATAAPVQESGPGNIDAAAGTAPPISAAPQSEAAPAPKSRTIPYSIKVTKPMDNLEFSILVDMTVLKIGRDKAVEMNRNPANRVRPATFAVTEAQVKQGFVVVRYTHADLPPGNAEADAEAEKAYAESGPARQQEINQRTDDMFWTMTGYKPGELLDPKDPNFKTMKEAWTQFRTDVVQDIQRWERIPPAALTFFKIRPDGIKVTAENIDRIVAIAEKVKNLSDEAMADYWERTSGSTDDLAVFERSVDGYLAALADRKQTKDALDAAHNKLVGKEELLSVYKLAQASLLPTNMSDGLGPRMIDRHAVEYNERVLRARRQLGPLLKEWRYADVAAFEADMKGYEVAFRNESIAIANEAMDRRRHDLDTFEKEVLTDDNIKGMLSALGGVSGRALKMMQEPPVMVMVPDSPQPIYNMDLLWIAVKPDVQAAIDKDPSLKKLMELRKQEDPNYTLDSDIMNVLVSGGNAASLKKHLTDFLDERREGIADTKENLKDGPDKIWRFDVALMRGKATSQVGPGSIQESVINDKLRSVGRKELGKNVLIGLAAVAAGLLTFGKGAVAVLGAASALGLGAYEAWDSYVTYAEDDAAHKAGMSSHDPSFAWVVVSLATLPLDVLALGSGIKAAAKGAHIAKMLEATSDTGKAVRAFNAASETAQSVDDVGKLVVKLERDLAGAEKAVRDAIVKAARAEAEANAAWAAARKARSGRAMAYIDPLVTPVIDLAVSFAYPVAMSIRKGITKIDVFLKTS